MSDEMRDELYQELFWLYFWPFFWMAFMTFIAIFALGLLVQRYNKASTRTQQQPSAERDSK